MSNQDSFSPPQKISEIAIDTDLDMGVHSLKADTIVESVVDAGVTVDGLWCKDGAAIYGVKSASEARRYLNAGEVESAHGGDWVKTKTAVLAIDVDGTMRAKFSLRPAYATGAIYGILTKNGETPGGDYDLCVQQVVSTGTIYVEKTVDITVDGFVATDTIDVWQKYSAGGDPGSKGYLKDFKLLYDNTVAAEIT